MQDPKHKTVAEIVAERLQLHGPVGYVHLEWLGLKPGIFFRKK